MNTFEQELKKLFEQYPEAARAMELWLMSSHKYEEAMRGFLAMPRIYSGGSTAALPPTSTVQDNAACETRPPLSTISAYAAAAA